MKCKCIMCKNNQTESDADNIRGEYSIYTECPQCTHSFVCCSDCGLVSCSC